MEENHILKYEDYKEHFLWTFEKERLECYFYDLYKKVLKSKIKDSDIINVSKNKKEQAKKYIDKDNGKVPDLIVVPKSYTYDKPVKQILNFESKIPDIDFNEKCIKRYNCIKATTQSDSDEIDANTKICPYLIFTDGLTWYIIKKGNYEIFSEQDKSFTLVKETNSDVTMISLVEPDENKQNWKWASEEIWDILLKKIENIYKSAKKEYDHQAD